MRRILASLGIVAVLASAVLAQPSPVRNPAAKACDDVSVVVRKAPGTRVRRTSGSVSDEHDQPDAPRADPYAVAVLCGPVSAFVRR